MGLIRFLLVIVLIFYAFSMIIKIIFNHKIKKASRQTDQRFADDYRETQNGPTNRHVDPSIGEYTEYEEVE